ncbi:MAG: RICIN domain-containing protein [Parvularculaceae bacterium]
MNCERILAALVSTLIFAGSAAAADIDGDRLYRLTTMWRGDSLPLTSVGASVPENRIVLAPDAGSRAQQWQFIPMGLDLYRIVTLADGVEKSLDIVNDGRNNDRPTLAATGNYSGQFWKATLQTNGFYRLSTSWRGEGFSLDVLNDGVNTRLALTETGEFSGQYWRLTPTGDAPGLGRSLVDRPDEIAGSQIKLIYVIPKDGIDNLYDLRRNIAYQVKVADRWAQEQVQRSFRYDTYKGALDITFVRLAVTAAELKAAALRANPNASQVTAYAELRALGFDSSDKLYVLYYDGSNFSGTCQSFGGGQVTTLVLKEGAPDAPIASLKSCSYMPLQSADGPFRRSNQESTVASTMVHEFFHSVGMVPSCAVNVKGGGNMHLAPISSDIMAFDGTGHTTYSLDTPRTQYYGHGRTDCPDLADSGIWADAPLDAPLTPP